MSNETNLPVRKHVRLENYDYSAKGAYFVTVCIKNRMPILGKITTVGRLALKPTSDTENKIIIQLTDIGETTKYYIENINNVYENICVDTYIIMPDHIHLLLVFNDGGLRASRPTEENGHSPENKTSLYTVVRSLKRMINRKVGASVWQDSYYEHVIRNKDDLYETRKYIKENPARRYFAEKR